VAFTVPADERRHAHHVGVFADDIRDGCWRATIAWNEIDCAES